MFLCLSTRDLFVPLNPSKDIRSKSSPERPTLPNSQMSMDERNKRPGGEPQLLGRSQFLGEAHGLLGHPNGVPDR